MKKKDNKKIAMHVSSVSMAVNILLSIFKITAGFIAKSSAMISDGVHSASDIVSTVIVMIGIKISSKESDREHQYGHERMECVAAIILSGILFATGIGIGISGIKKISLSKEIIPPGAIALTAAVISVAIKELMYRYTIYNAKKINSSALKADAWHHRSDALSSIGSFIGILGARHGFPILDPIAAIVICIFILKAAIEIFLEAIDKMTDRACDDETIKKISEIISSQKGVLGIDSLKTRMFGDKIYVDTEISADGHIPLNEAHSIAENVHDKIEDKIPNVKHCMVHVNPYKKDIG